MITEDLLYRKFQSAEFVPFDEESKIMPVRLKNEFVKQDEFFDFEKNEWKALSSALLKNECGYSEEFVEYPFLPEQYFDESENDAVYDFCDDDDLSEKEMAQFLKYRNYRKRMKFNCRNFCDYRGIEKDLVKAKIESDKENLILKITLTKFSRDEFSGPTAEAGIPCLEENTLLFNMKTGNVEFSIFPDMRSDDMQYYCSYFNKTLPYEVIEKSYERLLELAEIFTGVSFDCAREKIKSKRVDFYQFYKITKLPFCMDLYDIINDAEILIRKVHFHYRRNDSKIFNHFCKKYRIKNTRMLRKIFMERPKVLITFLRLKDSGFCDLNLYNRVIWCKENSEKIDNVNAKSLAFFSRYSIKKRGQKSTLNILLKDTGDFMNFYDGLKMFEKYFKHIPASLKKDILTDGFTEFNHDALSTLAFHYENKNITFSYSDEQKALEDEIDGYCFCLPKNSYELCEIGNVLHNCVASYSERVKNKECTIVCATKDGEYKICIEVRGKGVFQERVDRNRVPDKEQRVLLAKWRGRHKLQLRGEK